MAVGVAQFSKSIFAQKRTEERFWKDMEMNNGSLKDSAMIWHDVFVALQTCMKKYGIQQSDLVQGVVIDCSKVLAREGKNTFRICPCVRLGFHNGKISAWQFYRKRVGSAGITEDMSYTIRTTDAIKQQLMLRYFSKLEAPFADATAARDFIRREWVHGSAKNWRK